MIKYKFDVIQLIKGISIVAFFAALFGLFFIPICLAIIRFALNMMGFDVNLVSGAQLLGSIALAFVGMHVVDIVNYS